MNKYKFLIGVLCIISIIGYLSISGKQDRNHIKENGIYIIAKITKIATYRGRLCTINYFFKGQSYEKNVSCSHFDKIGERNFLIIIPTEPSNFLFTSDKVPSWFTAEAPVEGWKTMPTNEELRAIQNKADSIKAIKN